jgi:hypothetical protein
VIVGNTSYAERRACNGTGFADAIGGDSMDERQRQGGRRGFTRELLVTRKNWKVL